MKVLVVGSGAREHAIAWALNRSKEVQTVYVGPGNAGTNAFCTNLWGLDVLDAPAILHAALRCGADAVFVGPEAPLEAGPGLVADGGRLVAARLADGLSSAR